MSARTRPATEPGGWETGRLLPYGWRPDREHRPEDVEPRWVVVSPAGHLRLGEGTGVAVRPFRPADRDLLVAGFDRLSHQSRYRRFLAPIPRLTGSMLRFLTSVDEADHRAWGALVDESGGPVGAGVVRWIRSRTDPVVAEVAVTVIDDYHGRGLGGLLLDVAVFDAFAHGVDRFEGLVLGENISSRRMLARAGAAFEPDSAGVLAYRLPLAPRVEILRRSPLPALLASLSRRAALSA